MAAGLQDILSAAAVMLLLLLLPHLLGPRVQRPAMVEGVAHGMEAAMALQGVWGACRTLQLLPTWQQPLAGLTGHLHQGTVVSGTTGAVQATGIPHTRGTMVARTRPHSSSSLGSTAVNSSQGRAQVLLPASSSMLPSSATALRVPPGGRRRRRPRGRDSSAGSQRVATSGTTAVAAVNIMLLQALAAAPSKQQVLVLLMAAALCPRALLLLPLVPWLLVPSLWLP